MSTNIASGHDRVAVQVGRVLPADTTPAPQRDTETPPAQRPPGRVANVREGNATVDVQADVIEGGLTIVM